MIVSAIIGARKIFQRMTTYSKYTVAMTFRIAFTFGLLTVLYDWCVPPHPAQMFKSSLVPVFLPPKVSLVFCQPRVSNSLEFCIREAMSSQGKAPIWSRQSWPKPFRVTASAM